MARIIILAGRLQEANAYARKAGIHPSRYTAPVSARSIEGVAPSEVHILPGFRKRRDTHAIMAAVKRSLRRYQNAKLVEIDERGPLTERDLVVAHRYDAIFGTPDLDPAIGMAIASFTPEDLLAEQQAAGADPGAPNDQGIFGMTQAQVDEETEIVLTPAEVEQLDAALAEEPKVIPELAEALADEPKRRRSRCKVCNTLHFPGECPGPEIFE